MDPTIYSDTELMGRTEQTRLSLISAHGALVMARRHERQAERLDRLCEQASGRGEAGAALRAYGRSLDEVDKAGFYRDLAAAIASDGVAMNDTTHRGLGALFA